jgi:class 3 adenylate cyclase
MSAGPSDSAYRKSVMKLIKRLTGVARVLKDFDKESEADPRRAELPDLDSLAPNGTREVDTVASTIEVSFDVFRRHAERLSRRTPETWLANYAGAPAYRRLSVLSCDLTRVRASLLTDEPESAVVALSRYGTLMSHVINGNNGMFHPLTATGFLGVFGLDAEEDNRNDAFDACTCGLQIISALDQFNTWQRRFDSRSFRCSLGVHTGSVLLGEVTVGRRTNVSVVGAPVRTAMLLNGLADEDIRPLYISDTTADELAGELDTLQCDGLKVDSDGEKLSVHKVDAMPPHVDYRAILSELFPREELLEEEDELGDAAS